MAALRVGIVGCGLAASKRVVALAEDRLVATYDRDAARAASLAAEAGARVCRTLDELLDLGLDAVIVATPHDVLASTACRALQRGAHVLVEKPGARSVAELDEIATAARAARRVAKVGFNHRFHPGIARAAEEALSGAHGQVMYVRARYGHGGRPGYEHEWRARREISGGGELLDQGMHVLDLCHWILGPLPLHSALLRTSYWDMDVEDNAVLILGQPDGRRDPWAMLHASWSEWKNEFALEIYCRAAKIQVTGLAGSYGPQALRIFRMRPAMGPPDLEEIAYPPEDTSWEGEWRAFRAMITRGVTPDGLVTARYALTVAEEAYRRASRARGDRGASIDG